MKPIQIMMDESLLKRIDADPEARKVGRSAFLRAAAGEYLSRRRKRRIADAYRKAYSGGPGLGEGFAGWEDEGSWPAT